MSIMVTELYRALKQAGVDDAIAEEAASSVMSTEHLERLATKVDLALLRSDVAADLANLKADLLRWTIGLMLAQIGLFAGIVKLMLP